MIQSIYYYNVSLRHISYLKPSQYLLYVTSNGELYSWYMFVLLGWEIQPAIRPFCLLLRCHLTTRAYKQAIHFNGNGDREFSRMCRRQEGWACGREGGLLITYGHYVIVAAWQAQRNVCKSIHILSAIPKCVLMTTIWMMMMMMLMRTTYLLPAPICICERQSASATHTHYLYAAISDAKCIPNVKIPGRACFGNYIYIVI